MSKTITRCRECGTANWKTLHGGLCEPCFYKEADNLRAENARLTKALSEKGEYGYSQETMDALTKERDKLQARNRKLETAVEKIIEYELACKLRGVGHDIFVHDLLVEALVF